MDTITDAERIRLLEKEIDRLEAENSQLKKYAQQLKKAVRRCFYTIQMLETVRELKG